MTPVTMKRTRKLDRKTTTQIFRISAHVVSLIPLVLLIWDYYNNQLGVDPVREILLGTLFLKNQG